MKVCLLVNEGLFSEKVEANPAHTRKGFLTSPELFYVRNHGPVPQVHDADIPNWEISIEGLVSSFRSIALPAANGLTQTGRETDCPQFPTNIAAI